MRPSFKVPSGDLAWWAVPAVLASLYLIISNVLQGTVFVGGGIRPAMIFLTALLIFGVAMWFEQWWARWLGMGLFVALCTVSILRLVSAGFTWRDTLFLVAFVLCIGALWKLDMGDERAAGSEDEDEESEEDEDDDAFLSLVLLFREPVYLEASILSRLASDAWDTEILAAADPEELKDDDTGQIPSSSFLAGEPPHFFCFHPPALFAIHAVDECYFEDVQEVAESIPELRTRQAVLEHGAWVSVDLLQWLDDDVPIEAQERQAYRLIARLLAELADDNCLAVIDPGHSRIFAYDPETEAKLSSEDPLAELRQPYYAPILTIDHDDEQMQEAVEQARASWPQFVRAFEERGDDHPPFLVKSPFTDGANTEFMWLEVQSIENGVIYGKLGNEPVNVRNVHEGQTVRTPVDELNDWMCVVEGEPQGGFTLDVINRSVKDRSGEREG